MDRYLWVTQLKNRENNNMLVHVNVACGARIDYNWPTYPKVITIRCVSMPVATNTCLSHESHTHLH
jgi:hypothetical protein